MSTESYRHWPAFDKLCDLAEKSRLQTRLCTTIEPAWTAKGGEEYRLLTRIELWLHGALPTDQPMVTAAIYDDDVEAAALDLLQRVA